MNTEILKCPVCGESLMQKDNAVSCAKGHLFDISKEGYVNLLCGQKSGQRTGDSKEMASQRRRFLEKGYFSVLAEHISSLVSDGANVLDICCGEGYYSQYISDRHRVNLYGFDLSKSMIKLAAKRKLNQTFFVANLASVPIKSDSVDIAFHLFAPWGDNEFSRVLAPCGCLYTVVPGQEHLYELKKILYDTPYRNDEQLPKSSGLVLADKYNITSRVKIESNEDIKALFGMTPYFYHTSQADRKKLDNISDLDVSISFTIGKYVKEICN